MLDAAITSLCIPLQYHCNNRIAIIAMNFSVLLSPSVHHRLYSTRATRAVDWIIHSIYTNAPSTFVKQGNYVQHHTFWLRTENVLLCMYIILMV